MKSYLWTRIKKIKIWGFREFRGLSFILYKETFYQVLKESWEFKQKQD